MEYKSNNNRKLKNNNGIGFALLLILAGGIFLFLNLGIIPSLYRPILISWQMLLIVLGLWSLFKRQISGGLALIIIGGIFIYPVLCRVFPGDITCIDINFHTYWPVFLIIGGLFLVFGKSRNRNSSNNIEEKRSNTGNHSNTDYLKKDMLFGSSEQIVLSSDFKGGEVNVMFGEVIVDLRKATLAEGTHKLSLSAMFGNIIVYVPSDWIIEVQSSVLFAAFDDKHAHPDETINKNAPRLVVKGSCIFANGEIRN